MTGYVATSWYGAGFMDLIFRWVQSSFRSLKGKLLTHLLFIFRGCRDEIQCCDSDSTNSGRGQIEIIRKKNSGGRG